MAPLAWWALFTAAEAQLGTWQQIKETPLGGLPAEARDSAAISPHGRHIGWLRLADGRWCAVFDGRAEAAYDAVAALSFTPNSLWHAYAARRGPKGRIVVNSRGQPAFERVGPLRLPAQQPPQVDPAFRRPTADDLRPPTSAIG